MPSKAELARKRYRAASARVGNVARHNPELLPSARREHATARILVSIAQAEKARPLTAEQASELHDAIEWAVGLAATLPSFTPDQVAAAGRMAAVLDERIAKQATAGSVTDPAA